MSAAQTCANGSELPPEKTYLNVSSDPLQPCAGNSHVSFPRSFARSLLPTLPADDVVFLVPAGIGGTGFVDNTWTAYTGNGFVQAVARLDATWRLLHADKRWQQYNITFSAILWHQGEDDAGQGHPTHSHHTLTRWKSRTHRSHTDVHNMRSAPSPHSPSSAHSLVPSLHCVNALVSL